MVRLPMKLIPAKWKAKLEAATSRFKPTRRLVLVVFLIIATGGTLPHFVLTPKTLGGYVGVAILIVLALYACLTLLLQAHRGLIAEEVSLSGVKWAQAVQVVADELGGQTASQQAELEAIRARLNDLDAIVDDVRDLREAVATLQEDMEDLENFLTQ
jgi:hypothetical protein